LPADYHRKLNAERRDFLDLERDGGERIEIESRALSGRERLAGQLEQNTAEARFAVRRSMNFSHLEPLRRRRSVRSAPLSRAYQHQVSGSHT